MRRPAFSHPNHFSARSAFMGSMLAARRAGIKLAARATRITAIRAPAIVNGSFGPTPNNMERNSREVISASGNPRATPMAATHRLSRKTIHSTCSRCAPTARRTPISTVRLLTRYATVPSSPVATSTPASNPKNTATPQPRKHATNWLRFSAWPINMQLGGCVT
jgi:hypothetical protein